MRYEELSPELQEKVAACQTPEEVMALIKESGAS
ncbi:MAG: Nif11-like leader peptide family natural product precursor [Coriobacteriales bacterium]|nr:Nif11-like leader peptide family natural product precursor [Coriobacteriales bacterium]